MKFKKLVLTLLMTLPLTVFAEDVYDRINECQKKDDYKDCVFNILRELALQNSKPMDGAAATDTKEKTCLLGRSSSNRDMLHNEDLHLVFEGFELFVREDTINLLRNRWKQLSCGERSRIDCEMDTNAGHIRLRSGPGENVYFYPDYRDAEKRMSLRDIMNSLQEFICRKK
jgi:hypothetical protein